MVTGHRLRVRWDPEKPEDPGHRPYTRHRPIVSSPPSHQILFRNRRLPLREVRNPNHLLLRRSQRRPGLSAGVRSDGGRDFLERREHHRGLREQRGVVLRGRLRRAGKDYEFVYRFQ